MDLQDTLFDLRGTQNELERKSRDLACSNVELEHFAYTAANDLKQPLIVAGGYLNRLRRFGRDRPDSDGDTSS